MLEGVIYLCGDGATTMEAFSPDINAFLPLNITLPQKSQCCLYVDSNLLVVNSDIYILKYAVAPGGQLVEQSRVKTPLVNKYQNSQPVVDKRKGVYFMIQDGKCMEVNMQTGAEGSRIA